MNCHNHPDTPAVALVSRVIGDTKKHLIYQVGKCLDCMEEWKEECETELREKKEGVYVDAEKKQS